MAVRRVQTCAAAAPAAFSCMLFPVIYCYCCFCCFLSCFVAFFRACLSTFPTICSPAIVPCLPDYLPACLPLTDTQKPCMLVVETKGCKKTSAFSCNVSNLPVKGYSADQLIKISNVLTVRRSTEKRFLPGWLEDLVSAQQERLDHCV